MDFQPAQLFISYKFLNAPNAKSLEQLMLKIQVESKKPINFSTPVYNAISGTYETWYLYDFSKDLRPLDKLKINNGVS